MVNSVIDSQKNIDGLRMSKDNQHSAKKCCGHKMLLVDDSDFNLQIVHFLIKQWFEIELVSASDGEQALNIFKEAYN